MKRHWYLINTRWLRVYMFGSYAKVEINIGPRGKDLAFFIMQFHIARYW